MSTNTETAIVIPNGAVIEAHVISDLSDDVTQYRVAVERTFDASEIGRNTVISTCGWDFRVVRATEYYDHTHLICTELHAEEG